MFLKINSNTHIHTVVSGSDTYFQFLIPVFYTCKPWMAVVMAQVVGFLLLLKPTGTEFPNPVSLYGLRQLPAFGESCCFSALQTLKIKQTNIPENLKTMSEKVS